jgi:Casein kinase II regulatory subunit
LDIRATFFGRFTSIARLAQPPLTSPFSTAQEMLYGLIHARYVSTILFRVRVPFHQLLYHSSHTSTLWVLLHCSYIVTNRGMHAMYEKYRTAAFGRCPHVFCQGQPVLPVGLSDLPRNYTVNVFCPRCHGLFFPKSTRQANIDGAYFGTTFPHLYLMTHPVRLMCSFLLCYASSFDLTVLLSLPSTIPGYGPGKTNADLPPESVRLQS